MLLGLVLNYGILAPCLIEEKVIEHPPPKIEAVAAPQLPLAVKAGQTFTVQLEEAVAQPELPSPEELKADPELASAVSTSVFRYTWTQPTVYARPCRPESRPERADAAGRFAQSAAWRRQASCSEELEQGRRASRCSLMRGAGRQRSWEARLVPAGRPAGGILEALGLKLGPDADRSVERVDRAAPSRIEQGAMRPSAASATSAPGRSGRGPRCWWSAGCWRWPSNGGPWGGPSPASSPASAASAMPPRARWITSKFP